MSLAELRSGNQALQRNILYSDRTSLLNQVSSLWELVIQLPSMPPSSTKHLEELREIKTFFESALRAYIKCTDISGIEQCFEILTSLYSDYNALLHENDDQWKLWGLYLTYLLSYNKIEEFHSELEVIPWNICTTNKYINFAVALEQFFMEGNYQEVLSAKQHSPSEEFDFFVNRISDTIRFETAASFEKAYKKLSIQGACELLRLADGFELAEFLKKFAEKTGKDLWRIEEGELRIKSQEKVVHEIPKWQLINQAVNYAIELERIV